VDSFGRCRLHYSPALCGKHGRSPVRPTGCPGTQAKIESTILVEIFHPLCTPLGPKRGTPTGPASHHSATPVQYVVASRRRRRETSPRGSTHVCEGRGGRGVSPNAASQRRRRQQRCGSPATLPADACAAAPLPLPGFQWRRAERLTATATERRAPSPSRPLSDLVQKKRQGIKPSIYLSCISINLSLTSDFDSCWLYVEIE